MKSCKCGRIFSIPEFISLRNGRAVQQAGVDDVGVHSVLLRQCGCKSTIGIEYVLKRDGTCGYTDDEGFHVLK